jgi:hypothetical protein
VATRRYVGKLALERSVLHKAGPLDRAPRGRRGEPVRPGLRQGVRHRQVDPARIAGATAPLLDLELLGSAA